MAYNIVENDMSEEASSASLAMPNDLRIETWEELQRELFRDSWDDKLNRYRSPYVFRGLWNKGYNLKTSLMRIGGDYQKLEPHLLRNFRKYSRGTMEVGESFWNWLAVAQHHGLPTRLMDWTYSPYVALHFATSDLSNFHEDGVIWCVNYVKSTEYLPEKLQDAIRQEGSNVFTPEVLEPIASSLNSLSEFQEKPFVLFMEPPSLDERIVHQYALFSMMSTPAAMLCDWLLEHPELYYRIIIPAKLKWEIRDKLDQANITERVLFPGLSGISAWLKRHYTTT
ncbi:FRG domain-containing protein [Rufibacter sp. XAAS-G3-1]|uniref:FRG domain-containing protein n=1 Tax=Rufibacter sp. XAAS-G3-1 TaxID=2729134 RepID=UPI0021035F23|nr:FRG domain-containing protein [Rufibacter sp. XAAS-G3-1]